MDVRSLRSILLVRAVEESDRDGALLPPADRAEATRTVLRENPTLREALAAPDPLPGYARFLGLRAERILARLTPRHPALGTLVAGADRAAALGRLALVGAFLLGLALSALDGTRAVNVLAFPLAGLVAWNVLVYLALALGAARRAGHGLLAGAYVALVRRRVDRWLRRSAEFDAPLARALQSFAAEWFALARPLLAAHGARLLHLAAMTVALGLVAGLYWRGVTLEYRAGWESTFLGPEAVARVLGIVYGPASALSGIPLPRGAAEVAALRWSAGGEVAAPWIHLIALTAVLWIVLPRALLALYAAAQAGLLARRTTLPPPVIAYARDLLGGHGVALGGRSCEVVAYAYEPPPEAARAIERVLAAAVGAEVRVLRQPDVAYGEEDAFASGLANAPPAGDDTAIVCSLAGTPEAENHGTLIAAVRDARRGAARCFVIVDAAPYARRMGDGGRVAERARAWTEFVRGYGVEPVVIDLERLAGEPEVEAQARIRAALEGVRA